MLKNNQSKNTFWNRTQDSLPRVFSHRGNRSTAFENTLSAYSYASKTQVDGIEIDVSLTSDGKLI